MVLLPCSKCCATCDVIEATSGGDGVTEDTYTFPPEQHVIRLDYNSLVVPDRYIVTACDKEYVDTGMVSGTGSKCFVKPKDCTEITVRVEGGPGGTLWSYSLGCKECCPCLGCIELRITASAGDDEACQFKPSQATVTEDFAEVPGIDEPLRCVRRFNVIQDEQSGSDVVVGDVWLSIAEEKATMRVALTQLNFTATYEKESEACPPQPDGDTPETIVFTESDIVSSEGDTSRCGSLTYTFVKCPPPPPPPCDPPCEFNEVCCDGVCKDPACPPCHQQDNPGQYVAPDGSWFTDCQGYQGVLYKPGAIGDAGFRVAELHTGNLVGGASMFAPSASPFISAYSQIVRGVVVNGLFGYETENIPIDFDDCGDGTDCGWANYEAVQAYVSEGYQVRLWVDSTVKETDNQIGDFLTGIEGGYTLAGGTVHRYRAFVFSQCDENWQDKTSELLKRTELRYFRIVLNGPNAVEIEPQYMQPLQPAYRCTREENPLP